MLFGIANVTAIWMVHQLKSESENRRLAAMQLERGRRRLQDLSRRLLTAQEEERRRIALDLHDDLTQEISFLGIELSVFKKEIPEKDQPRLDELHAKVGRLVDHVRAVSHELHPSVLEHSGLVPALEEYCAEFREREGVDVKFRCTGDAEPRVRTIGLALYRITQEALRNAVKHGGASTIWVNLISGELEDHLSIIDDGDGFDVDRSKERAGIGLIGMHERAELAGGTFSVTSEPGEGTRVEARIPRAVTNNET